MNTAGYSHTPLIKKLGIKPGMKIWLMHAPQNYASLFEGDITQQYITGKQTADFIHLFAVSHKIFLNEMRNVLAVCKKNTSVIIWVSWYKKSSGIATDLSDNIIREFALQNNLVDIKVCAVTEEWSGLKLLVPVAKR